MLDPEHKAKITGEEFCKFLIEIGLPLDCVSLHIILCKIKQVNNIQCITINTDDISYFCRGDHKTNTLLEGLNNNIIIKYYKNKVKNKEKNKETKEKINKNVRSILELEQLLQK